MKPACALLCAVLIGAAFPAMAGPNDILIGLDSKVGFTDQGQVNIQPGQDAVLVMDVSDPAAPKIRASLPLTNSLLGPPTNLQITPDGRLGLVANSVVHVQEGSGWKAVPDDKLYVIDLAANPPRLIDTVTVGKQPSGLDISRRGDLALIANRAGKSVTVLSIQGNSVKVVGEVQLGQEVAGVAITPDGRRAFAVMNQVNKVAVLEINGQNVTYDKAHDIPAAFNPYNIAVTPDGKYAIASSTGAGGLNADALTVIDTSGPWPHVVNLATAGPGAEGLAISPDGKWMLTPLIRGSSLEHSNPGYRQTGEAVLLSIGEGGTLRVSSRQPLGGVPEGVAFSPSGEYVYVGNYVDQDLQTFRLRDGQLVPIGGHMRLPGQPASIRGVAR
jgi:DNA-binding beta-propeller fold protein YncE